MPASSPPPGLLERKVAKRLRGAPQFTVAARDNGCAVVGGPPGQRWVLRVALHGDRYVLTVRGRTPESRRALRNALIGKAALRTTPDEHHVLDRRPLGSPLAPRRTAAIAGLVERWARWLDTAAPRTRAGDEKVLPLQADEVGVYWWDERANFGDAIGPWLVRQLTGQDPVNARRRPRMKPVVYGVGSIIGYIDRDDVDVWGAGLMAPLDATKLTNLRKRQDVRVHAVRGARTRDELITALGWDVPEVYGDPALLLPRFYQPKAPARAGEARVAVVPHYVHQRYFDTTPAGVTVVDVAEDLERVIDQIASAQACVSTSLHGAIIAQAYGVPWVWLRVTDHPLGGDAFKFDDFFSTLDASRVASRDVTAAEIRTLDLEALAATAALPELTISLDALQQSFPLAAGADVVRPFEPPAVPRGARASLGRVRRIRVGSGEEKRVSTADEATSEELRKLVKLTTATNARLAKMAEESKKQTRILESIRLAVSADTMAEVQEFVNSRQLTMLDTIRRLATTENSLARFGDGEFRLMLRSDFDLRFQRNSAALQKELLEVFQATDTPGLDIGFPQVFRDAHWTGVWAELWPQLRPALPATGTFVNSHVTRPLAFSLLGDEAVQLWREVWRDKRVVVITGAGSRFEADPALFSSAISLTTVESLATHAYADLDRVVDVVLSMRDEVDLALISLGPSGTVLAPRLHQAGLRALDLGHIVNSYQNIFSGAPRPESVPLTTER